MSSELQCVPTSELEYLSSEMQCLHGTRISNSVMNCIACLVLN